MAGSGRRVFAAGEVLTASNVMNYLQDQAVMVFADSAARTSALGASVSEGMVSYLLDTNKLEIYEASAWRTIITSSGTNTYFGDSADTSIQIAAGTSQILFKQDGGTERARIDASGNFLIAKSTTGSPQASPGVHVTTAGQTYITATGATPLLISRGPNSATAAAAVQFYNYTGTAVGSITVTSSATAYVTSSDYRLKENVVPLTDGIERLMQLEPKRFNFTAEPETQVDGFIAHEVQEIIPNAAFGEKDAIGEDGEPLYQGIDHSKLVPVLTAALQEAVAKIESLEARVVALEAK